MNTLTPEAIEMLADDYERGMIGPRRLRQYFDYLIQQLAAAKAELAELAELKSSLQFNFNSVVDCLKSKYDAEQELSSHYKAKAEQAEAQCAAYKKALDIAMSTNQIHETYCKVEAALEEKP